MNTVSELNKLKARLFVEAVLNEGRLELIDEMVAADYIGHVPGTETAVIGPEGVRQFVSTCRRVCPGLYIKIEDQIAEDDRVVTRWQATTTAAGAQPAAASAGRTPCYAGISVVRFLAGMQVDSHTECTSLTANRPGEPARNTRPPHLDRDAPARSLSAISLPLTDPPDR